MIKLISYGNQLCSGKYKLHSKFTSAVNFISGDTFVFVVSESVGPGPLNIVIKGIVPMSVNSLEIEDGRSEEHTSELQSLRHLVCRLLLEKHSSRIRHCGRRGGQELPVRSQTGVPRQ